MNSSKKESEIGIVARKLAKQLEATTSTYNTEQLMRLVFTINPQVSSEKFSQIVTHNYILEILIKQFQKDNDIQLYNSLFNKESSDQQKDFVFLSRDESYEGITISKNYQFNGNPSTTFNFLIDASYKRIGNNRNEYHQKAKNIKGILQEHSHIENLGMILFVSPLDNAKVNLEALTKDVTELAIAPLPFSKKRLEESHYRMQEQYAKQGSLRNSY